MLLMNPIGEVSYLNGAHPIGHTIGIVLYLNGAHPMCKFKQGGGAANGTQKLLAAHPRTVDIPLTG